jgi:hypothetical protein
MSRIVYRSEGTTPALDGSEWSSSHSGLFTPGEIAGGTHCIGIWVGPRAGRDAVEKDLFLPPTADKILFPHLSNLQPIHCIELCRLFN